MCIRRLAICILLFACSCRLIVDPDRFRDQEGNDGSVADAPLFDATPLSCDELQSRYVDIQALSRQGTLDLTGTHGIVYRNGSWQLVDAADNTVAVLAAIQQGETQGDALVLAVDSLILQDGAVIEARGAQSTPPLVVVAESDIIINGKLDVSSKDATILGMGANPAICAGQGSGQDGQLSGTVGDGGGGGGGGGFGKRGGDGGAAGDSQGSGSGGAAISGGTPDTIRGGCAGGKGVTVGVTPNGRGGNGGGAVHLIACNSIVALGTIHAGGGGGGGGASTLAEGGGGGGSGGYIGLEAPAVLLADTTVLAANGGGGGGASQTGGGDAAGGEDASASSDIAPGGTNTDLSGNGGNGGALSSEVGHGTDGSGGEAGAGGGGGVGIIYLHTNSVNLDVDAIISPPAQQDSL